MDDTDLNSDYLALGELSIKVLAPLSTPDTVAKTAYVSIAVAFTNPEFVGPIDRGLKVEAQMEGVVEQTSTTVATKQLTSEAEWTNWGNYTFGENVKSLKEYCRRYQSLGCVQIKTVAKKTECISRVTPVASVS